MFDSNTQSNKNEVPLEEQDLQGRIETLSNIVSNLEDIKKKLDNNISEFEANNTEYEKSKILLSEILNEISNKKVYLTSIVEEVNTMNEKRLALIQENDKLEISSNLKKQYISDIETYKKASIIANEEMNSIEKSKELAKKDGEKTIKDIKSKIIELHESVGSIVANLK